jgi:hypothetical protein
LFGKSVGCKEERTGRISISRGGTMIKIQLNFLIGKKTGSVER